MLAQARTRRPVADVGGGEQVPGSSCASPCEEVEHDSSHELGVDPGLVKDGVEAHLQALLAEHVELLGAGYTLVRREYMTAIGPGGPAVPRRAGPLGRRGDQAPRGDRRGRTAHPLPRPAQPGHACWRPVSGVFAAQQDQAAGPNARHRPRDPLRHSGLRPDAWNGQRRVPVVLSRRPAIVARRRAAGRPATARGRRCPAQRRVEAGPDGYDHEVRPGFAAPRATKAYRCPGCDHEIRSGTAHVVVWRGRPRVRVCGSTTGGTGTPRAGSQPGDARPDPRRWS